MQSSPTIVMKGRGRRAAMGALLVAALVGLVSLLMAGNGYAAEAKPKPKPKVAKHKSKPKPKKKRYSRPKVKGHVKKRVATVIGTPRGETIVLRLKANNPNKIQVDVGNNGSADWQFNRNQVRQIVVLARGGNDIVLIDESNGVFTDTEQTIVYGEDGNDDLRGGSGPELFFGGLGNDTLDTNKGNDIALLGAGDDSFTWDPGDGSDVVEGQAGTDTMVFNGNGLAERFEASAVGPRVRFTRDLGNIVMNLDGVEKILTQALGGADTAVVNDLSGTDLKNVELELESAIGSNAGDGAADSVTVNGTSADDTINVVPNAGGVDVTGLAAAVRIEHSEAANDSLLVNGLGGNDTINGNVGLAALIKLSIDGGAANDTINGGDGSELLLGGDGNDAIDGNRGNDTGLLGAGDDSFRWDPGDGNDVIEGQAGTDTMLFNGAGVPENFDVSANGSRVRFFRDAANITMDLDDVEKILTQALGGADNAVVNDLSGTDLREHRVRPREHGRQQRSATARLTRSPSRARTPTTRSGVRPAPVRVDVTGLQAASGWITPRSRTTVSPSSPSTATTSSQRRRWARTSPSCRSTAATATTRWPAAAGPTRSSGARATTSSTAIVRTTSPSSATATTRSSGIRATATTSSRARPTPTRCCSTAPVSPRTSTSRRTAPASASSATRRTSPWISTTWRRSTRGCSAESTPPWSTT